MTLEELKQKEHNLRVKFDEDLMVLRKEYAANNNSYKIGDVFADHIGSIIIEAIKYSLRDNPCCVYFGTELKKDGTPRKDGSKRQVWQSNEKK